jgi:hypothetical protein
MKKFITLLAIGMLLLPAIGEGYQRRVDSVRGRNGRVVRRYRYNFRNEARYRAPNRSSQSYGTQRDGASRYRRGGYGPNYYRNYHPDYPGLDFGRYDMMPYYHADRMWRLNQRIRNGR